MAVLFSCKPIHVLFPKYLGYVLNRNLICRLKSYVAIRQSNYIKNLKTRHIYNFTPILSVVVSHHLRNSYYAEVSYTSKSDSEKPLNLDSLVDYENVSEETLQSLYDRFEEVLQNSNFADWDVNYSNGVLTATLERNCVYVINKQTPNRQIWLSSPVSGPKRYDYLDGTWIYKHDGFTLHQLLSKELTQLLQKDADFFVCTFSI